jgi:cell wall-associated NlpC family hydrolase
MLKIKPKIKNSKAFGLVVAGLTLAMISTCSAPALGDEQERLIEKNSNNEQAIVPFTIEHVQNLQKLEQNRQELERIRYDQAIYFETLKEEARIANPKSKQSLFVNKALQYKNTGRWVFGGSTPGSWDCSGFVMYVAKHSLDVDLYHSATVQMESGIEVTTPIKGDLVGLYYHDSSEMSSHIGIYVGDGKFIHVSETRGTVVSEISKYKKAYDVRYSRIIEKKRNWSPEKEIDKQNLISFFD